MQTSIGRKHPKIIDVARESATARSDKSLHRRCSMSRQMWTLHFRLMRNSARSRFFFCYEVTSRALWLTTQQISMQNLHLTANEKARTEGLSCLKMADSRAQSMVFGSLRPMLVRRADLTNAGHCARGLEKVQMPQNEDAPEKITRFHATLAAESTRLWLSFLLLPHARDIL